MWQHYPGGTESIGISFSSWISFRGHRANYPPGSDGQIGGECLFGVMGIQRPRCAQSSINRPRQERRRTGCGICKKLGIEKRHTTAYHPQSDGVAERNIGSVKQAIRCLLMERRMDKGSWPTLLTEVSFLCNGVTNSATKISPQMLTFERQPRSPMDIRSNIEGNEGEMTPDEYWGLSNSIQRELSESARRNQESSAELTKLRYDQKKKDFCVKRAIRS